MFSSTWQIAAFGAFCVVASAAAPAPPAWTVARTANFEVYSDAGPQTARSTVDWLEELRAFFLSHTGLHADGRQSVRAIVFRSAEEYNQFRPTPAATAFYVGNSVRDYIVMEQTRTRWAAIAAHEYAHSVMHANGLALPRWLSEGLADIFSTVQIDDRSSTIGGDLAARSQTLRRTSWVPLPALMSVRDERAGTDIFYAESWALAHMLAFSPEYSPRMRALIAAVVSGDSGADALTTVYGKSLDAIARDLRGWADTAAHFIPVSLGHVDRPAPAVECADVPPTEQRRVIADLLLTSGEFDRAEKLYRELQREMPSDADVAIALGEIALRKADKNGALRAWKQGIERGSRDPKLCYRYAVVAQQAGVPDAEIRPMLERAVALDPGFDDARYNLALMDINGGDFEGGVGELRAMRHVAAERRYSYWSAMANALNELDRRDEAKAAAHEASRHAVTAEEHAHAAQLAYIADTDLTVQFARDASGRAHMVTTRVAHNSTAAWNPFVEAGDQMRRIEGTLDNIDCSDAGTRIEVKSDKEALTLSIPDPSRVQMRNAPGEFTCGPQSAHVIVDYAAQKGIVRAVEFR